MIVNNCINVTKPEIALDMYADRTKFKMFMGDTGLLVSQILNNGGIQIKCTDHLLLMISVSIKV